MRFNSRTQFSFILIISFVVVFFTNQAAAVPQFARRYNLRCSACHTIAPVLNEQGYMFKKLGYRLPPALEQGKVADWISSLVKKEPEWKLTNNASVAVTDFSYVAERKTTIGFPTTSTSAFQVGSWNVST